MARLVLFWLIIKLSLALKCVRQLSNCACETDYYGEVLDFSPLDAGGKAKYEFQTTDSGSGITFHYNPCSALTCGNITQAAVCALKLTNGQDTNVGAQSTATFEDVDDDQYSIILRYLATNPVTNKSYLSDVDFECRANLIPGSFSITNNLFNQFFLFRLETQYACVNPNPPPTGTYPPAISTWPPGSLFPASKITTNTTPSSIIEEFYTPGWIFVTFWTILLIMYLIIGILINKFCFNAKGTDLLPNKVFWLERFLDIKACFSLIRLLVSGAGRSKQLYESAEGK